MNRRESLTVNPHLLDDALGAWRTATERVGGVIERTYVVAGHPICLRFAGPELVPLVTRALEHLATSETETPALTIHVGDSASTGLDDVPPSIRSDPFGRGITLNGARMGGRFEPRYGSLSLLDLHRGQALFWAESTARLPYWETSSPLRHIFHWWMTAHGLEILHAAAVGNEQGGVLLVGKGGSGKSSCALACLESDLSLTGDDYQLADIVDPPVAHSLYNSAKLERANLERFPKLAPHIATSVLGSSEKGIVFIHEITPDKIAARLKIRAVLVPTFVDHEVTWIAETSAGTALTALAPSTIGLVQLGDRRSDAFSRMATLLKLVPSFGLNIGRDIREVPAAISTLLADLPTRM